MAREHNIIANSFTMPDTKILGGYGVSPQVPDKLRLRLRWWWWWWCYSLLTLKHHSVCLLAL